MIDPKDKLNGFTLVIDGKVVGKFGSISSLAKAKETTDYVEKMWGIHTGNLSDWTTEVTVSRDWVDKVFGPETTGKSMMGLNALRRLLEPGHLYVRAQLEMWGVERTREVCLNCLYELITTLEAMGYRVWFEDKDEWEVDLGIVRLDYQLQYVGRGEGINQ